ncbi:MAG: hypothetical protein PHG67_06055 [Bacteroidales bacterium]|jgi:hypothetical protein|nr:hypothetical protein [Bacteroidales bacterium]HOI31203.1 hypothetical protein [Bacteroidales bacterium]
MSVGENTKRKAEKVRQLVEQHYEPGRQDRNKRWVFRNVVVKIYPMSERNFWRYMTLTKPRKTVSETEDPSQLKLF